MLSRGRCCHGKKWFQTMLNLGAIPVCVFIRMGAGRGVLEGGDEGRVWDPRVYVPKIAQPDFPVVNCFFSRSGHFGRGGGVQGGTPLLMLYGHSNTSPGAQLPSISGSFPYPTAVDDSVVGQLQGGFLSRRWPKKMQQGEGLVKYTGHTWRPNPHYPR